MFDLHIHTNRSDGVIDINAFISNGFSDMRVISFCDHEIIFDPQKYVNANEKVKYISGAEICCNISGIPIELLAYRFNPVNSELYYLIDSIKKIRNDFFKNVMKIEDFAIDDLITDNIFRMHIKNHFIDKYGSFELGWRKYSRHYVEQCHSVSA